MIPGIGSLGGAELLIALIILLLFFGAKRLPELGRSFGIGVKELRKEAAAGVGDEDKAEQRPRHTEGEEMIPSAGRGEPSV
jgi:sec-independent protein translocase protein TatA